MVAGCSIVTYAHIPCASTPVPHSLQLVEINNDPFVHNSDCEYVNTPWDAGISDIYVYLLHMQNTNRLDYEINVEKFNEKLTKELKLESDHLVILRYRNVTKRIYICPTIGSSPPSCS